MYSVTVAMGGRRLTRLGEQSEEISINFHTLYNSLTSDSVLCSECVLVAALLMAMA